MKHLDESELSALVDRALEDRAQGEAERHIAECATCRAAFTALDAQDRSLARMLQRDPSTAYFETFAARVQERIRTEGVTMDPLSSMPEVTADEDGRRRRHYVPARESLLEQLGRWFSGPRIAWAGAAVAMIVGAGVVFLVGNEQPTRMLEDRTLAARAKQVEELAAPPAATRASPEPGVIGGEKAGTLQRASERTELRPLAKAPATPMPDARGSAHAHDEIASRLETESRSAAENPVASPAPSGAAKLEAGTPPGRSRQVRRENGEDVPVQAPGETPRATNAPSPSDRQDANVSRAQRIKEQARKIAGGPLDAARETAETSQFAAPRATAITDDLAGGARVCGTVRDANGRAIEGARVAFADLGSSTTTDASGNWCLVAAPGEHTVMVMAVGFREMRRSFGVTPGAGNQDFTLVAVSVLGNAAGESAAAPPWPPAARGLAAAAERASFDAVRANTASSHDSAAMRWQRVNDAVTTGPASIIARQRLAEARYRAWQLDPSRAHAVGALAALSSYLAVAPSGPEREIAQRRLEQLQRP